MSYTIYIVYMYYVPAICSESEICWSNYQAQHTSRSRTTILYVIIYTIMYTKNGH